jgi:hypothetical protein
MAFSANIGFTLAPALMVSCSGTGNAFIFLVLQTELAIMISCSHG